MIRFPIYFIWEKATRSPTAATVFMAALFAVSFVALNAVHQTASRLTWSFARDDALFLSSRLSIIHPTLGVPVYALLLDGLAVLLVGIVYVCSTTGMFSPTPICAGLIRGQHSMPLSALRLLWHRSPMPSQRFSYLLGAEIRSTSRPTGCSKFPAWWAMFRM